MPFTPAHILAVLPAQIYKPTLPFSALAIGAMIPDIPLFFPFMPHYRLMHSLEGLFLTCLPLGVLAYFLIQVFYRTPVSELLPVYFRVRLPRQRSNWLSPSHFWIAALCVLFGAFTHVLWDSFTHTGRWGVRLLPFLSESYYFLFREMTIYKFLQYTSTIIGLVIVSIAMFLWFRKAPSYPDQSVISPSFRWFVISAIFIAGVITAVLHWNSTSNWHYTSARLASTFTTSIAIMTLGLSLFTMWFHIIHRSPKRKQ